MFWLRRLAASTLVACVASLGLGAAPSDAATSDHDKTMIDVDTPVYVGYDSDIKAYHFRVTGRWLANCGGDFCWDVYYPGDNDHNMGSNDAVGIRFSDAVQFKKFRIQTYDACGKEKYDATKTYTSSSFENAYAGVNDEVFAGWTRTTNGGTVIGDSGTCKLSTMPTYSQCGGSACVAFWADMKGRSFTYNVWINPAPSQGTCYDRLYVKGRYTHTWTSDGLAWSVGYPWGVGVGPVSGSGHFTVFQGGDGFDDPDLTSPRMCRH